MAIKNKNMKKQLLFLALILFSITLNAQGRAALRRADTWFARGEFMQAIIDYEIAINHAEKRGASPEEMRGLYVKKGETFFLLREYILAEPFFAKAYEIGMTSSRHLVLYANTMLSNDRPYDALTVFNEALELDPQNREILRSIEKARFNIMASGDQRVNLNHAEVVEHLNLSTNQYGMNWYKGALMFSCDRIERMGEIGRRQIAPSYFYYSNPVFDFRYDRIRGWAVPVQLSSIKPDEAFAHSIAFDENASIYYVTRCLREAAAREPRCNIFAYYTTMGGGVRGPIRQSFHRRDANVGHPTLSSDGTVMFFSIARDGNSDLFMAQKIADDIWTEPVSLGPIINTEFDEVYPSLYRDSILFFSSDGHLGMGGLDIFFTRITVGGETHSVARGSDLARLEFSQPVNLGSPFNSGADDISFLMRTNGCGGFFISNRTHGGDNRKFIWSFENEPYVFAEHGFHLSDCLPGQSRFGETHHRATAVDLAERADNVQNQAGLEEELARLQAQIDNLLRDNRRETEAERPILDRKTEAERPILDRVTEAERPILDRKTEAERPILDRVTEAERPILDRETEAERPILDEYRDSNQGVNMIIGRHLFDFGSSRLRPGAREELQRLVTLMRQNPNIRIEINGHTDNIGSLAVNQRLSENRAKAIRDFLIQNGIQANRMTHKGHNFSKPLMSNDTAWGRSQNRRVEIKVL